jgi:predicted O-linked N-acetylglucosamine transferase (SPINDLY family)
VTGFQQAVAMHRQGNLVRADALCIEVLRIDPRHAGAWHLRGLMALAAGDAPQAVRWLEHSLTLDPRQPAAHLNIGNFLLSQHAPERALASFERALVLKPDYPLALYNRANALCDLRRFDEALAGYDAALRLQPNNPRAITNRGMVLLELGRSEEALAAFQEGVHLEPESIEAHANLGSALLRLAEPRAALESYETVCRLAQKDARAWCGRGNALAALKRPDEAATSYTRALELEPDLPDALVNRAAALQSLRRASEALQDSDRALRLNPQSVPALNNAGNALVSLERAEDALRYYDEALRLDPASPLTLYNRAIVLRQLQRLQESAQSFLDLLRIAPKHAYALGYVFQLRMDLCDWSDHESLARQIVAALEERQEVVNPMSMLLLDCARLQRVSAEIFASSAVTGDGGSGLPVRSAAAMDRIRVAYVSADFREHPVAYSLVGALERHDRARFEVIGLSLAPSKSGAFEQRVRSAFDRFIDVSDRSDQAAADLLRQLQVDVAVDLMGFTEGQRLGIFSRRAAPVQVGYLGYAGTMGVPYLDYLLADAVVIPEGCEHDFSESVVRLPHCFMPLDDRREVATSVARADAGLPATGFVFCAFTNACKISPSLFDVWMRLLREVPDSVLWLRAMNVEARANLAREAERRGVDHNRLVVAPRVEQMAHHLARHACADLYLDTYPYNAHSTACDALWAGVPVLTCAGPTFASRVAASVLTAAGLPELITYRIEDYAQKALELARQPHHLHALRERLVANRASAPLFDTERFTRHLEAAYETMHGRAVRGELPAGFAVKDRGT